MSFLIRFDKKVHLPFPDIEGRKSILELYGNKVFTLVYMLVCNSLLYGNVLCYYKYSCYFQVT